MTSEQRNRYLQAIYDDLKRRAESEESTFAAIEAGNRAGAVRLALTALAQEGATPAVCATCEHLQQLNDPLCPGEDVPVCGHPSEAHPLHWCQAVYNADTFGCTFWKAKCP